MVLKTPVENAPRTSIEKHLSWSPDIPPATRRLTTGSALNMWKNASKHHLRINSASPAHHTRPLHRDHLQPARTSASARPSTAPARTSASARPSHAQTDMTHHTRTDKRDPSIQNQTTTRSAPVRLSAARPHNPPAHPARTSRSHRPGVHHKPAQTHPDHRARTDTRDPSTQNQT